CEGVAARGVAERQGLSLDAGGEGDGADGGAGEAGGRRGRVRHGHREPVGRRVPVGAGADPRLAAGRGGGEYGEGRRGEYGRGRAGAAGHDGLLRSPRGAIDQTSGSSVASLTAAGREG